MEAGSDLIISVKDVFDFERILLEKNSIDNFPEEAADRVLAYFMGVHDFAKLLAEEITGGNERV